jgi:uncharacterized membrane protein
MNIIILIVLGVVMLLFGCYLRDVIRNFRKEVLIKNVRYRQLDEPICKKVNYSNLSDGLGYFASVEWGDR